MFNKNTMPGLLLLSSVLGTSNVLAATVYEKVEIFKNHVHFTDGFTINTKGVYEATLTDFKFPNAFKKSGMNITTGTNSLGELLGTGSFTFEAGPGDYHVSMFAQVGGSDGYAAEKQRLIAERKQQRKENRLARWNNLTKAEREQKRDIWKSRTKEEREARREERKNALDSWAEEQLADLKLGQYGIQINMLEAIHNSDTVGDAVAPAVVPVPAAAWLFGSGILALAGIGRRARRR